MNNIIEIAHRGNSHYYKDNSIQSFTSALDENFDMIELDIQLCRSGEIVVNHDLFIDYNFIKNMDLNEIQEIDSDIITLKQFFEIPRMKDIDVYLDLKGDIKIAKEVVKFINVNNLNKAIAIDRNVNTASKTIPKRSVTSAKNSKKYLNFRIVSTVHTFNLRRYIPPIISTLRRLSKYYHTSHSHITSYTKNTPLKTLQAYCFTQKQIVKLVVKIP